jgi:cysteine desulfurase
LLTTPIEHKSVIEPLRHLSTKGWHLDFIPIEKNGRVNLQEAEKQIASNVFLISVQLANSEIGTIQDIKSLAYMAHQKGVAIHCDASQAVGKMNMDLEELDVDILSFSGHKINGPKGIGGLWIKKGFEKVMKPIMYGGGQMLGLRPGTLPVSLVVGMGKACEILLTEQEQECRHLQSLRDAFEAILLKEVPSIIINGAQDYRLVNNSSVTFPDVDAEALLLNLEDIVASTGSACESGSIEPSRVLTSIGISAERAFQTIRFGFGRFNTMQEVQSAASKIVEAFNNQIALQNAM